MKRCTVVVFFLALALVTKAIIRDNSTIDLDKCKSELRVKILGFGQAILLSRARDKCTESCREGVDDFKRIWCPRLCGEFLPQVCVLCYPNKFQWISRCRKLIDVGFRLCEKDCRTSRPDFIATEFRVTGTSGTHSLKFPSVLM